jgi:hypothetical protein
VPLSRFRLISFLPENIKPNSLPAKVALELLKKADIKGI